VLELHLELWIVSEMCLDRFSVSGGIRVKVMFGARSRVRFRVS
jgi:hypothetical protein